MIVNNDVRFEIARRRNQRKCSEIRQEMIKAMMKGEDMLEWVANNIQPIIKDKP